MPISYPLQASPRPSVVLPPHEADRPFAGLANVEDVYPLTPLQEGMLLESLRAGDRDPYILQIVIDLAMAVDIEKLGFAWRAVVGASAALRTCFLWEGFEAPVQVVRSAVEIEVRELDRREADAVAQADLEQELRRGFLLNRAPLLRVLLVRTQVASSLVVTSHHLIVDGWSLPLILSDAMNAYLTPDLGLPRRPPFRGYVDWVRAQDGAAASAFFREDLRGFGTPTTLDLPRPSPLGTMVSGSRDEQRCWLSVAETEAARRLARHLRITESTLVLAAISLVISRYVDAQDLVVGMTVSGRSAPLPGIEDMVGNLINTIPARIRLELEMPICDWLRGLQTGLAVSRRYEWVPLAETLKVSEIPADIPLFEILYVYQNYPIDVALEEIPGVLDVGYRDRTNYPLTLWAQPGRQLQLIATFDDTRFHAWNVENLLSQIRAMLTGLGSAPERALRELRAAGPAERQQLLAQSLGPQVAWPDVARSVHGLIEAQVDSTPDAVAACDRERTLTYRELEQRANRAANALLELGVGPSILVGVCCERRLDFLVAVLGVLKAGAAYVPLDPRYPEIRSQRILAKSGLCLVICDDSGVAHLGDLVAGSSPARARTVGSLLETCRETARPAWAGESSDLVYAIFTSGSTGEPKGALVEHHGKVNHILAINGVLTLEAHDVVAQTASACFDISVWQLLGPLAVGARVELVEEPVVQEPLRLLERLHDRRCSVLEVVPSYLALLASLPETARQARGLRWVISIGEALAPETCRRWLELVPGVPLLNAYGPAECSDVVTFHPVHTSPEPGAESCPIGEPLANLSVHVLSKDGELAPSGACAELWLGGRGVGRGYLNDPELTASRFVRTLPRLGIEGRFYRSGDLGRFLPGGRLDWVGRVDHQVKIRGCLVQPVEIEAVLDEHPAVESAVILPEQNALGEVRLLAAILARTDRPTPEPTELRAWVRARLPSYMVPSTLAFVDAIPHTPNGKTDRGALLSRIRALSTTDSTRQARTELEVKIAAVFGEVLGMAPPGLDASFYELGGHSLVAMRLAARLRAELGVALSARDVFEAPTVAEMSLRLESLAQPRETTAEPSVETRAHPGAAGGSDAEAQRSFLREELRKLLGSRCDELEDVYPLTPAQLGMYRAGQGAGEVALYSSPAVLELEGHLERRDLEQALEWLVARHPALRSSFVELETTGPLQLVHRRITPELEWLDLRGLGAARLEQALASYHVWDRDRHFSLDQAPLFRVGLLRRANRSWWLCWTQHHLITDAWSWRILFSELVAAIEVFRRTDAPPVVPEAVPYRAFVDWLHTRDTTASREHWRRILDGFSRPTLGQIAPPARSIVACAAVFDTVASSLPSDELLRCVRDRRLTLAAPVQAALALSLAVESGESDVLFATVVAGRPLEMPEAAGVVGMFLNVVPVRVRIDRSRSLETLLTGLHRALGENLDYPLLPAHDYQALSAVPPSEPLAEVVLAIQDQPFSAPRQSGEALELVGVRSPPGRTQFPLFVEITPAADLEIRFVFRSDRFPRELIERLHRRFCRLLARLAVTREETIDHLLELDLAAGVEETFRA